MSDENRPGDGDAYAAQGEARDDFMAVPDEFDARTEFGEAGGVEDTKRELAPWHRPRKHYVRTRQWTTSLDELVGSQESDEPIRYLGLPGDDFLDIRHLAGGTAHTSGRKIRFLGFNDGAGDEFVPFDPIARVTSEDEVRRRDTVDEVGSVVMPDDIRRISSPDSPAFRMTKAMGPFDVVNLDLCQSFFATAPEAHDSYTKALLQIVGLQSAAKGDWLLWVTTRVNRESVHPDAARRLLQLVQMRFSNCAYVVDEWAAVFDCSSPHDLDLETCSDSDFTGLVFVGLALWILELATGPVEHGVNITSNFSYRVRGEPPVTPDMFSMVIRFSPRTPVPNDYTGLTVVGETEAGPDRCQKLEHVVNRLSRTVNIDDRVKGDSDLRQELIDGTADLLEEARVDRDHYVAWVSDYAS